MCITQCLAPGPSRLKRTRFAPSSTPALLQGLLSPKRPVTSTQPPSDPCPRHSPHAQSPRLAPSPALPTLALHHDSLHTRSGPVHEPRCASSPCTPQAIQSRPQPSPVPFTTLAAASHWSALVLSGRAFRHWCMAPSLLQPMPMQVQPPALSAAPCMALHAPSCRPVAAWPPVSRHVVLHSVVESVHRRVRSAPQHMREVARQTAQVKAPAQAQPLPLSAAFALPPIHAVLMLAAVERGFAIRCMVRVLVAAALREG